MSAPVTPDPVTASLVIIGNEILSGRTKDANLAYLAEGLTGIGVRLMEVRVVPDIEDEIIAAVQALSAKTTYVFTTGGIGPTHDDITSAAIAKAFGTTLHRDPDAVRALEAHYDPGQLTEARLKMAEVPVGATLIDNPVSKAPGFKIGNVHVMAGVPRIFQAMFDGVKGGLKGGPLMISRTVSCGLGEGIIAQELGAIQDRHPTVEVGSYPYFRAGQFGVSLVGRSTDPDALDHAIGEIAAMITKLGGTPVEVPTGSSQDAAPEKAAP